MSPKMEKLLRLGGRVLPRASPFSVMKRSFVTLDSTVKIEEEHMLAYERGLFYPVHIGDVFKDRYQVLNKLGFGANSTVWFCRDLCQHRYIALKVCTCTSRAAQEAKALTHLASIQTHHPGKDKIRMAEEMFEINGPSGQPHQCLVHEPLVTSILHFQSALPDKSLPEDMLKPLLREIFTALDFMHSEADAIHTDIQAKNIMIATTDPSLFETWEKEENEAPSPRKIVDKERVVYQSRPFWLRKGWKAWGMPLLSDFGEARIGRVHEGLIQPDLYRAPEVVLGMKWTSKVDIWNVACLIWDLFEDHHLFNGRGPDRQHSNAQLLAEMISLLGPAPVDFPQKSEESVHYWDESEKWKSLAEIPDQYLEELDMYMEGENEQLFMQFMRKMLRWAPEERHSARELLNDPWLNLEQ